VRLAHADNNDKGTVKRFADGQIAADARVVTDGHAGYDAKSLGKRPHDVVVQTKAERRENDAVQGCHWTISLVEALAHRHARRRGARQAPAGLPRRVRLLASQIVLAPGQRYLHRCSHESDRRMGAAHLFPVL
jgi:hypothetical protein